MQQSLILKHKILIALIISTCFLLQSCFTIKTAASLSSEYFNLASQFYEIKSYDKAIELYKKAIEYDQHNTQARLNLISSYQNANKHKEAEILIKQEYRKKKKEYEKQLLLLYGKNLYALKNYQRALELFNEYTEVYPEDALGFYNKGLCLLIIGNEEDAHENFMRSYQIDSSLIPAIRNIAFYLYDKKEYEKALFYFKLLTTKDADKAQNFLLLAIILYEIDEMSEALTTIQNYINKNKDDPEGYILIAKVYAKGFHDKEKCFKNIETSLEKGYKISELSKINDFSLLREKYKSEYNELIKKYIK